ncbi:fibronectin type III domain-containing protein [Comamonas sp. B-9]|uniref:fibronectin type III domain-containing protein n=1 Tax=Comamonas sp. B-9 TaxID=1055192 RepID=UPI0003958EBC|nr:fibronectin type III domain-containing protein [Comamonas sp. B-9]
MTRHPHYRLGSSIALLMLACTLTPLARAAELVVNGGFEQNAGAGSLVFTGWQAMSQPGSQGGFYAQQGTQSALTPVTVAAPPQGTFAAMSDQPGPGSHALYQDIAIPAGKSATLSAQVYLQSAAPPSAAPATLDFLTVPNQQARIDIMDPAAAWNDVGAGVLANVFQWPGGAAASGYQSVQLDVTPYAGRTIRLRLAEVDNRQSLFFGVDAISVISSDVTPPTSVGAVRQGNTVTLTFPPVASTPTETVTGYQASCVPVGGGDTVTATGTQSPIAVSGLVAGTSYTCTVAAQTNVGTGPSSPPISVPGSTTAAAAAVPAWSFASTLLASLLMLGCLFLGSRGRAARLLRR